MSISIEAAELLEIFQWRALARSDVKSDDKILNQLQDEMADIMIYLFALANNLEIDLSSAVLAKLEKNAEKYPV
jgi:NTP pyrophosphatase (non-canonical NTP hydrolase)